MNEWLEGRIPLQWAKDRPKDRQTPAVVGKTQSVHMQALRRRNDLLKVAVAECTSFVALLCLCVPRGRWRSNRWRSWVTFALRSMVCLLCI